MTISDAYNHSLPLPRFCDDERVRVSDPRANYCGEYGQVQAWYFGMAGSVMYVVILDGSESPWVFHETELERA